MGLKNLQNLKKLFRKPPALNVWVAIYNKMKHFSYLKFISAFVINGSTIINCQVGHIG